MHLINKIKNSSETFKYFLLIILFTVVFLGTRLPYLGMDEINPDAVNWHYRSEQFMVALKGHQWANTYQHYHPGVTLMWVMGITVELVKRFYPGASVYNNDTFLIFHTFSKYVLVFVQLILSYLIFWVLSKVTTKVVAFFTLAILTFEPFILGNSRILHLDILAMLLLFLAISYLYLYLTQGKLVSLVISAVFLAFAFLTKSVAVGGLLFAIASIILWNFCSHKWGVFVKKSIFSVLMFVIIFTGVVVVFFPAMWVSPVQTVVSIFQEAERIGIRNGHGQVILGEYTENATVWFYALVFFVKFSPFMVIGFISFLYFNIRYLLTKHRAHQFSLYLSIFYFTYLLVMSISTKKIDRYILMAAPFFAYATYYGYKDLVNWLSQRFSFKTLNLYVVLLYILTVIFPIFTFYPYYFTYSSPLFVTTNVANAVLAQKPFGIGIPDLKKFIFERYGDYPRLGFYDTKPMKAIYKNSRICDVRVCGSSDYDILVLGINEPLPNFSNSKEYKFEYSGTFKISGLNYWRIYVKKFL